MPMQRISAAGIDMTGNIADLEEGRGGGGEDQWDGQYPYDDSEYLSDGDLQDDYEEDDVVFDLPPPSPSKGGAKLWMMQNQTLDDDDDVGGEVDRLASSERSYTLSSSDRTNRKEFLSLTLDDVFTGSASLSDTDIIHDSSSTKINNNSSSNNNNKKKKKVTVGAHNMGGSSKSSRVLNLLSMSMSMSMTDTANPSHKDNEYETELKKAAASSKPNRNRHHMNNHSISSIILHGMTSWRKNGGNNDCDDDNVSVVTTESSSDLEKNQRQDAHNRTTTTQRRQQSQREMKVRNFLRTADDWTRRKLQYVWVFVSIYAFPVCVAIWAPQNVVSGMFFVSIGCVTFVNLWMLVEGICSFFYTRRQRKLHHSRPDIVGQRRLAAIVAAYLPNELTVLVDTIRAISKNIHELPDGTTLDIVLSHNGGSKEQRIAILEDIRKIEREMPANVTVHELNVVSSRSKAENVNAGLAFLEELGSLRGGGTGKTFTQVAMYDADHQPIPQAWRYALETMQDQEADMVMGRCCVQDGLKYVSIEFDILYQVAHSGGRCVRGFGFFGGSNGYWDFNTLVETGMDEGMLTEDVDSSFRAQAAGHYMTYDPTIVSYEESPPDFTSLFKQRLRWAQGWYEVTWRQITLPFRSAPGLTLWSRFCIFLLLPFREMYVYLSSFTVPIAVVYLVKCGWVCVDYRLLAFAAFCFCIPICMTFSAWYLTKDRTVNIHYRNPHLVPMDYFKYLLVSFPYELFKIQVTVMSHARQAMGLNKWVVTKRKGTKDPSQPIYTDQISHLIEPELLIVNSPHAPAVGERQLFSGTYDERRATEYGEDPIKHCALVVPGSIPDSAIAIPIPRTLKRRYSFELSMGHHSFNMSALVGGHESDVSGIENMITEAMLTKNSKSGHLVDAVLERTLTNRALVFQELNFMIHAVQFPSDCAIETLGTGDGTAGVEVIVEEEESRDSIV
eukprot:CAMPEP_0113499680 /NCGR_PEP_ID=MMETSP0014_2-20120614/31882_1 /TAXON_ID=2857 /ORGANISM="Nitzschia sp." /LENGTH=952 /DNA_ID=CAMNT_0000393881 /DNA_START=121 /DNA_END=2979 /DNA_ORIENTATION=- /assembly_acc=CAM_ASM_000159